MTSIDRYAVKQVKGPYVVLANHPDHCESEEELKAYAKKRREDGALLGVDLFAGAGGLSQGLTDAGIEVIFGVDHYDYAVDTHSARFPGMSVGWDLSTKENVERVANLMEGAGIEVLAGGPPCQPFSKAGRSGIRHLVERGERDPIDQRRNLWRAYLEVVQLARPKAVIMENVPDMALDNEMFILRSMIEELEQIGYSVEARVIETWRYGVPQFRQRLILVALRGGIHFEWPEESESKVTVWNAIGDMPEIEGGWRPPGGADGWAEYDHPITDFQEYVRRNVAPEDQNKLFDHITRPVREDDREAFELMSSETKYSDLPKHLQRYRSDIFTDKYKRLDEDDLSRTITAHIAKDGYGFIHPRQSRTLSVREAARLQTFPDDFRFSGPPSAAFKQIGNAVPVLLGKAIGDAVVRSLRRGAVKKLETVKMTEVLSTWYQELHESHLFLPWLRSDSRWKIAVCEIFLERASRDEIRVLWPMIDNLDKPESGKPVPIQTKETILKVFSGERFKIRREKFKSLIGEMENFPEALWAPRVNRNELPSVNPGLSDLLELAAPVIENENDRSEEPVIVAKGVLRVTSRFHGVDFESRNKLTDGRISIASLLGLNLNSRSAHLALFELARSICIPESPHCAICPLERRCAKFGVASINKDTLF